MAYYIMILIALSLLPSRRKIEQHIQRYRAVLRIKRQSLNVFASFLLVFLFSATRYGVGTDYFYTYVPGFIVLRDGVYTYDYYETGFELLNRFCLLFTDNYQSIFVLTSLIIYGVLFYIISKYSDNPKWCLYIYFASSMYFNSLSNVRQGIAMTLCLLACCYYIDKAIDQKDRRTKEKVKEYFSFYALVLIAFSIHTSAIVFAFVPLLGFVKNARVKYHILIALVVTLSAIGFNYVGGATNVLNVVLGLFERYQRYSSTGAIYWSFLAFNTGIYILMYLSIRCTTWNGGDIQKGNMLMNLQFIAIIILLFSNILPWADRIARYFMIVQCYSIPYLLSRINKQNNKQMLSFAYFIVYLAWIIFYSVKYQADGCFPYQNIMFINNMWQKGYFGN